MAKDLSIKITYTGLPPSTHPSVEKLQQSVKEAGLGYYKDNPDFAPPTVLFASGATSEALTNEIQKSGLDEESRVSLEGVRDRLKLIEEENQELFGRINESYLAQNTQVEITEFKEEPGYVSLKPLPEYSTYQLSDSPSTGHLSVDLGPAKSIGKATVDKILAPAKKRATQAGLKIAGRAAVSVATKSGGQAAAQAVGQVIGTSAPIIGNVVSFIVVTIIGGTISWLQNQYRKRKTDAQEIIGGALLALSSMTSGFFGFLGLAAGSTIAAIAVPFVIALVSIPVVITIILFIINSGAYLVPPSNILAPGENPYISVTKEASGTEFENSDLPITVTYTITITPLKGSLTNISFSHKCEIISDRPIASCPAPLPSSTPVIISPASPYIFTYSQTYSGTKYLDSLVLNTFSITADTDEASGITASGAASIIIGNPPTGCYVLAGEWPDTYKATVLSAIGYLVSNYTSYVARVCSGGEVRVHYAPGGTCGVWGCARRSGDIELAPGGLKSATTARYILTHESGHLVSWRLPSLMQQYLDYPGAPGERPLCSYSATSDPWEAFPESAALYVVPTISSCISPSYPAKYPVHYQFADQFLF